MQVYLEGRLSAAKKKGEKASRDLELRLDIVDMKMQVGRLILVVWFTVSGEGKWRPASPSKKIGILDCVWRALRLSRAFLFIFMYLPLV